jgi:hypothetical protein
MWVWLLYPREREPGGSLPCSRSYTDMYNSIVKILNLEWRKALLRGRTEGDILSNMFDFDEFFISWKNWVGSWSVGGCTILLASSPSFSLVSVRCTPCSVSNSTLYVTRRFLRYQRPTVLVNLVTFGTQHYRATRISFHLLCSCRDLKIPVSAFVFGLLSI